MKVRTARVFLFLNLGFMTLAISQARWGDALVSNLGAMFMLGVIHSHKEKP